MYTKEDIRILKILREDNVAWSTIAKVLQKTEGAVRTWWARNQLLLDLPSKPIISRKKTAGRIGLQIKKMVQDNPNLSVRDIEGELKTKFSVETDLPKKAKSAYFFKKTSW